MPEGANNTRQEVIPAKNISGSEKAAWDRLYREMNIVPMKDMKATWADTQIIFHKDTEKIQKAPKISVNIQSNQRGYQLCSKRPKMVSSSSRQDFKRSNKANK